MSELIHTMTIEDQAAMALAINTVIEAAKRLPFWGAIAERLPFVKDTAMMNRIISFSLAFSTATGIEFGEYSFVTGGVITFPPAAHIVSGILTVVMQGGMQEGLYKFVKALNVIIATGNQQGLTTGVHAVPAVPQGNPPSGAEAPK